MREKERKKQTLEILKNRKGGRRAKLEGAKVLNSYRILFYFLFMGKKFCKRAKFEGVKVLNSYQILFYWKN